MDYLTNSASPAPVTEFTNLLAVVDSINFFFIMPPV
jgi:hypothetical protein